MRGDGEIVKQFDYAPFGAVLNSTEINRTKFIGKEKDKESNYADHGVRKYDDEIGRFTSIDPLWEKYYSLTPYQYAGNNPVIAKDAEGEAIDVVLDAGFIAYDLYDIGKSIINGKQVTSTQIGALLTDVACAATPFATGGGIAFRAASKADDAAKVANNAISKEVSKESVKSFKSVENLIESAGKLERLKGGVHQGSVKGNPIEIFTNLAKQYGAKIESNGSNKYFFKSGKVRVDFYNSYTKGTPTIHIDNNGQLTKIRVTQ